MLLMKKLNQLFKVMAVCLCLVLAGSSSTKVWADNEQITYHDEHITIFSYNPYRDCEANNYTVLLNAMDLPFFHASAGQSISIGIRYLAKTAWDENRLNESLGIAQVFTSTGEPCDFSTVYTKGLWTINGIAPEDMDFYIIMVPYGDILIRNYHVITQ